ncbi:biotin synthase BioB [Romboutsia sp. 1001713B170131_170501_G6]|uniref:biotin synthase BioB n=1 Tax=Romboutsia sp. 1001713B170131_170501_G6 TaxID=2787108 RepID=UPI0018A93296|nr:biotin synthase BioB [Romboutsia sp. 1001713B170131_170501_G6]
MLYEMTNKIKNGYLINRKEAIKLLDYDFESLGKFANEIREYFLQNEFDICSIVNGKSGRCSEDCKFCAQSSYHTTDIEVYPLKDTDYFVEDAKYHKDRGIKRYSIVTSGKKLSNIEIDKIVNSYKSINKYVDIKTCASHGLLSKEDLRKLKKAGVKRYHNNLETSRNYFDNICTTHTYDEKIKTIKDAQSVGLEVCSGGIFGLGESEIDRIDMAFEIRDLGIKSIPLNALDYIKGTKIDSKSIKEEEFLKMVAIYRFINPSAQIRLAGGRNLLTNYGELAFKCGANATISGDLLTTCGNSIADDIKMIEKLGFEIR